MKRAALILALLLAGPAAADSNRPPAALAYSQLPDAAQEARARALMETLRCLVCLLNGDTWYNVLPAVPQLKMSTLISLEPPMHLL